MLYDGSVVNTLGGMKGSTNALVSQTKYELLRLIVSGILHLLKFETIN